MPTPAEPEENTPAEPMRVRGFGADEPFRLLVDAVQDYAIFLLSPDGHVLTWNLGAERIKGYRADEIIGRHFSSFYTPEELAEDRPAQVLAGALENGRVEDEGWRVRKDGSRFWADVVVTALRNKRGTLYGFAKITRDLTERRAAEEQAQRLRAEQEARAAAEDALAARDRFLSIASHELKTPIASVQLAAESLLRAHNADRLDGGRLDVGLKRMTVATGRLAALVNELLDITRLGADALPFNFAPMNVVELVREIVERFEGVEEANRIEVVAPADAWIEADASRLDQVFSNLIENALKYSTAPAPIWVEVTETDDEVEVTVSDEGIGFDDSAVSRMFDAFGRGANVEHISGMGLGLYISRQILDRHGGRIEARPRPGRHGAIFHVTLPRATHHAG